MNSGIWTAPEVDVVVAEAVTLFSLTVLAAPSSRISRMLPLGFDAVRPAPASAALICDTTVAILPEKLSPEMVIACCWPSAVLV